MFKDDQMKLNNKPPSELIQEALRLWGKSIKELTWEEMELGKSNQFDGKKTFHCPKGDVCELIEFHNLKFQEKSDGVQYGIGLCLSCDKIYWGKIERDFTD